MPEGGENKENQNNNESFNKGDSWISDKEKESKKRHERIEKSLSRADKILENIKNKKMSNSEKNIHNQEQNSSITWPEMHVLLQPGKGGKTEIKTKSLAKYVKLLSTGSENRINISNLDRILQEGDAKFAAGEYKEKEWGLVASLVDEKLTKLRGVEKQRAMVKEVGAMGLSTEKDIPSFFKQRSAQEKELEAIFKKNEEELTSRDKQRTLELVESLYKKPLSEMDMSFFGSSGEKPPKVEEIGIEAYKKWFEDKIHALIEEYPDQNFETNWTLTYTIQQAVNNLWPKEGRDEFEYKVKDASGNERMMKGSYTELRKELAEKLESYRAIHNFIYLYRRVPGVGEAIGPAGLLETKYLQCLMREKGVDEHGREYNVADALRKIYEIGEEYRFTEDRDAQKAIAQKAMLIQDKNWQGRLAGGLYSAFQGGGRDGHLTLNQGGDFFTGRLYNMPLYAKILWENKWVRKPWPNLYKALDLKVKDFWADTLDNASARELENLGIETEKINEQKIYRFKNAKFDKIDLISNQDIPSDHLKHVILDLEEADNIRKMILNPRGLLDEPKFAHITAMWEKFKHLKGKDRSEWFAPVIKELAWFFKDKVASWNDSLPMSMRRCPAQEVYPHFNPMDDERITDVVWNLTPPLRKEEAQWVLNEVVGSKAKRVTGKATRVVGGTIGSMILEGFKALFGLK